MYARRTMISMLAVGLAVLAARTPAMAALIIDDFSRPTPQAVTVLDLFGSHEVIETVDPGILGGERDVLIDVNSSAGPVSYAGTLGEGTFLFGSASPGAYAMVQYDGIDTDGDALFISLGLDSIDLTEFGNGFYLDFLSLDGGGSATTDLRIDIYADGGVTGKFFGDIPSSPTPFRYVAPFSSFASSGALTEALNVTFTFNDPAIPDVDFLLDEIGIPEPATFSLLALAALALRRKRQS